MKIIIILVVIIIVCIMFSGGDDKEKEEICRKIKSSRKYREFSDFVDLHRENIIIIGVYDEEYNKCYEEYVPTDVNANVIVYYSDSDYFKYNYAEQKWEKSFDLSRCSSSAGDRSLYKGYDDKWTGKEFFSIDAEERKWTYIERNAIDSLVSQKLTELGLEYRSEVKKDGRSKYAYIYTIRRTEPKTSPISKNPY